MPTQASCDDVHSSVQFVVPASAGRAAPPEGGTTNAARARIGMLSTYS